MMLIRLDWLMVGLHLRGSVRFYFAFSPRFNTSMT